MNRKEIDQFMHSLQLLDGHPVPVLVETHISWVILTVKYAYKIKKPVKFAFLDFSTLSKRKYFCERELSLNKRLAPDMYIGIIGICKKGNSFQLLDADGEPVDYAVQMKRMDTSLEMDRLIRKKRVGRYAIMNLARKIAAFHTGAQVIQTWPDIPQLKLRFNDIGSVKETAVRLLGPAFGDIILQAIGLSDAFLGRHKTQLAERASKGYIRDVHGDLHTGNIFLYTDPVVFDCIEFNDELRQMDVLNEVAFLCMDLDAWQRHDLSELFFDSYSRYAAINNLNSILPLFNYYKAYCANIRAKVALLSAADRETFLPEEKKQAALRYLNLLKHYLSTEQDQFAG